MEGCLLVLLAVDSTVQPADVTIPLRNVISHLDFQLPTVWLLPKPDKNVSDVRFKVGFCVAPPLSQFKESPEVLVEWQSGRVTRSPFLKLASQNNWSRSKGNMARVSQILLNKKDSDSKVSCASIPPVMTPRVFASGQTRCSWSAAVTTNPVNKGNLNVFCPMTENAQSKAAYSSPKISTTPGAVVERVVLGMNAFDASSQQQHPTACVSIRHPFSWPCRQSTPTNANRMPMTGPG